MTGNPLFGKFGPILLAVAVQIGLILAVPSTAPAASSALGSNGAYNTGVGPGGTTTGPGGTVTGPGGTVTGPGGTVTGPGGSTTGPGGTVTGQNTGGGQVAGNAPYGTGLQSLPGDKTHCVNGRQFDPNIDFYAPPCVPGAPGAAYANNGGATGPGVTGNTIEVVNYVADYGAEVDKILQAQGLYYNADTAKKWNAAYQDFMNTHYQFWGRKIHIDTIEGTCQTVPPKYDCLIAEMDKMVAKYHPYAVFWETTVCSVCFAELSRLHVVNFGGGGFSDKFHNDNAPYSYDAGMSASRIQLQFANWWCNQMANKNAIFAGTKNPTENFRNTTRQLGVISTNDQDNEWTVKNVLYPALAKCGQSVKGHEYFYAQDINTATTQSQETASKMNTPTNPATSVLCLCDPVAPQFGLSAFAQDNYWPESLIADDQTMDFDSNAQTYSSDDTSKDGLACPNGNPCAFDNTIGLSSNDPEVPGSEDAAVKIWHLEKGSAATPVAAATLDIVWSDWSMFASLVQNSGPVLNAPRMQAAAPQLGMRGGDGLHPLKGFAQSDWCWIQDVRVVYWDRHPRSPYNNTPGHYIQIEGGRYNMNFPAMAQPPAPAPENRK